MNQYVTGTIIKKLRESKKLTQAELAERLHVSDKAISKWETGKGYPDITLIEPIAGELGISVAELLSGSSVTNCNRSFHMMRSKLYVCPICGNVMFATGEAVISCCGISLPPLEAEEADTMHDLKFETVEDEYYVSVDHDMTKEHHLSFFAAVYDDRIQIVKLYQEGNAETRFKIGGLRMLYVYCNRHGLFQKTRPKR